MARQKVPENYAKQLEDAFARWEHLNTVGGTDPSYPDGANMDLVRNHIRYYKLKIKETMKPEDYPATYHRPDPPKVEYNYFADPERIRRDAAITLERYKQDGNLQFLLRQSSFIPQKHREKHCMDAVLNYYRGLAIAVERDDLLAMRRHRNGDSYIASFARCAEGIREIPKKYLRNISQQLSLFG